MADASNLNVLVICGSLRKGSYNAMVANTLPELAPAGMKITRSPTLVMPLYNADVQTGDGFPAPATALSEAIRAADGVIFVTPEYNYSIPGVLKNALDWVSRPVASTPLMGKPAAVIGASTGLFGAVWAQAETRKVLSTIGARVVDREIPIPQADEALGADGLPLDDEAREQLDATLTELIELTRRERVAA